MLLNDLEERGVIILCETFLNKYNLALTDIENYQAIHKYRDDKPGGGTSLFIHDSVKLIREIETPFESEFESVSMLVQHENKKIFVSEFYRLPNTDDSKFESNLGRLFDTTKLYKNCFLMSDQNYDLLKTSVHHRTGEFLQNMLNNDFIPLIWKPTRITHATATLIDNVYVKTPRIMKHNSFVIVDGMSDHFPCLIMYALYEQPCNKGGDVFLEKRKITDENLPNIQQELLFHDWSVVYDLPVNAGYEYLIKTITDVLDTFAPKKVIKIHHDQKFREGWLTVKMKKYNNKSRRLRDHARKTGKDVDYDKYRRYRNTLNRLKNFEKRSHYKEVFENIGKNTKLLWNVINRIVKRVNNKHEITELLVDGKNVMNEQSICNALNDHFATVGKCTQDTIGPSGDKDPLNFVDCVKSKFKFSRITEGEICKNSI